MSMKKLFPLLAVLFVCLPVTSFSEYQPPSAADYTPPTSTEPPDVDASKVPERYRPGNISTGAYQPPSIAGFDINGNIEDQVFEMMGIPKLSDDEKWWCTCILCLANPNGAKAVSECVPPIDRLLRELAKGHFRPPTCPGSNATIESQAYENCPEGYRELTGEEIVRIGDDFYRGRDSWRTVDNSGNETGNSKPHSGEKICVRGFMGNNSDHGDHGYGQYQDFESIVTLKPISPPWLIEINFPETDYSFTGKF